MSSHGTIPARALLALIAGVVAMHAWLLHQTPAHVDGAAPRRAAAFATRRIEMAGGGMAPARPAAGQPAHLGGTTRRRTPARPQIAAVAERKPTVRREPRLDREQLPGAAQVAATSVPPATRMEYVVSAQRGVQLVHGTSALEWNPVGEGYEASFSLALDGRPPRRQHSAGQLGAGGLEPWRFAEIDRGEQATHFERDGGRVIFSNNRPAAPLPAGVQDRLSVLVQLGAMVAADPGRYPAGTQIAMHTATTREVLPWVFDVRGPEQLQLPAGEMTTVKLERPPQAQYDQRMEIWLAPGKAYVPVRLRLTQPNGDWVDHQWSGTDRR